MSLTRDHMFAARKIRPTEVVEVPELGGSVIIRTLTLGEVREIQTEIKKNGDSLSVYPRLVFLSVVDDAGDQIFSGDDIKEVNSFPWPAIDRIANAVLKLNKMGDEDPKN